MCIADPWFLLEAMGFRAISFSGAVYLGATEGVCGPGEGKPCGVQMGIKAVLSCSLQSGNPNPVELS